MNLPAAGHPGRRPEPIVNPASLNRTLQLVEGSPAQCRQRAATQWRKGAFWVGDEAPPPIRATPPRELESHLGSETDLLVFDAHGGLDVEAFAMALGLVRGGGRFLLLIPPLSEWPSQPDREMERLAASGWPPTRPSRFIQRLVNLLQERETTLPAPPLPNPFVDGLTRDQEAALTLLERTATGHPRRPLLITADRGRGKSALLGIGAAHLLKAGKQRILVTAPRQAATRILFEHAGRKLRGAEAIPSGLRFRERELRFMAPDALLAKRPPTDLLLVDEAAGIPLPLLLELVRGYNRLVMATTVHGYEGSGRGFELRLQRELDRLRPGWRRHHLRQPVRWAAGDPLERFGFRALLLDAEPGNLEGDPPDPRTSCIQPLAPEMLLRQPQLLEQLFGLLVSAHYRTKPSDLRYLLDAPNLRLWVARQGETLLGAVLVAEEGSLPAGQRKAILEGQRRPRGHLLPQLLATRCGISEVLGVRCWRVVRIAVHPRLQRRGLGSRLLDHLLEEARREEIELVGSCFGATTELARFWLRRRFLPLRLGHRREASSGAHALVVARGTTRRGREWVRKASCRFQAAFPLQLGESFAALDPELALTLRLPSGGTLDEVSADRLLAFGQGRLPYLDALEALHRLASRLHGAGDRCQQLLVAKVLQRRPWPEVAERFGLSGRREAERMLRGAVLDLLPGLRVGLSDDIFLRSRSR